MQKMQRLSFDMPIEEHKYLKMCCAKMGVSLKEFIIEATLNRVYAKEDEWLLESPTPDEPGENFVFIDEQGNINDI